MTRRRDSGTRRRSPLRRAGAVALALVTFLSLLLVALPAQAAPEIELKPNLGPVGTPISVQGTGFTAANLIEVRWDAQDGPVIGDGATDSAGNFLVTTSVPGNAQPGQHLVYACKVETVGEPCREVDRAPFQVTSTTTTSGPTTTATSAPTTTDPEATTTTSPVLGTAVIPTLPPGHGAGSDDYTWWDNTTSTFPNYPYAGPTAPPPRPDEQGIPSDIDYPDIRVTAIEITQGVQNLENAMPLVRGRHTYARVYIDIPDDSPSITYNNETTMWPGVTGALGVCGSGTSSSEPAGRRRPTSPPVKVVVSGT